jgi:uncharacterized membrane protein YhaH (DUF805 family)
MENLKPAPRPLLTAVLKGALLVLWPIALLFNIVIAFWAFRRHLFSFEGRVGRKFYWVTLLVFLFYGVSVAAGIDASMPSLGGSIFLRWVLMTVLVIVPLAVSALAVGVKRLHDSDRSGRWLLTLYAIPAALIGIPALGEASDDVMGFCILASLPFLIGAIFILGCKRGTVGPNAYGAGLLAVG